MNNKKYKQQNGFVVLAPIIILSTVLFILVATIATEQLLVQYQFISYDSKNLAEQITQGCVSELEYKVRQGTLTSYLGIWYWADSPCQVVIEETNFGFNIELHATVFQAKSSITGRILPNGNFIES